MLGFVHLIPPKLARLKWLTNELLSGFDLNLGLGYVRLIVRIHQSTPSRGDIPHPDDEEGVDIRRVEERGGGGRIEREKGHRERGRRERPVDCG